jgi:signal transduction histidine kinase
MIASTLFVALMGVKFGVVLASMADMDNAVRVATNTERAVNAANSLERLVFDLETGWRGYALTRDERFLGPWTEAQREIPGQERMLERSVAGDPGQAAQARQIIRDIDSYVHDYSIPAVEGQRRGDASALQPASLLAGNRLLDDIRAESTQFLTTERQLLSENEANAAAAARRVRMTEIFGWAAAVLAVAAFTWFVARAIIRPVRQVSVMADRLAEGDLSRRMPEDGRFEIGALERSFNTMAGSLEASRDDLSRLASEQAVLRRVATLVARGMAPDAVFNAVTEEMGSLFDADVAALLRFEPDGAATVLAGWSVVEVRLPTGERVRLRPDGVVAKVRSARRPARVEGPAGAGILPPELTTGLVRSAVGAPIVIDGQLWGAMTAVSIRKTLAPDTAARTSNFADLVATAVANAQARADLAASRTRIVAAADRTRRQIEHDLHDGTQQRLVSLLLALRATEAEVPADLPAIAEQLSKIAAELEGALGDLREISRGIHPAILSEGGLPAAIRSLGRRSPMAVECDVSGVPRLPPPIEIGAYYVVAEALANAVKHAHASLVRVDASVRGDVLNLCVEDNGIGGADPDAGTGIIGLVDRVEALGGSIRIASRPGAGTTLRVELPTGGV